jgi:histidinol-phosphate aminotransferase
MPEVPRIRQIVQSLPGYRAGRRPAPQPGLRTFKSSSNENPYDPLPEVVAAMADAVTRINRYPDPGATQMTQALASRFGVTADEIATGTGSVGVLGQIMQALIEPGDEVVYAWRSFEAYPIVTAVAGGRSVVVPVRDERHDLNAMADAITDRTRVVILCTPNNPTGTVIHRNEFTQFMTRVPSSVLVLIDEAYAEFVTDPDALDGMTAYHSYPNVAVLRSFAKAFGLAGVRVGVCISQPDIAAGLRKTAVPFGVSEIAQVAVLSSLEQENALRARVASIIEERDDIVARVRDAGFTVADQQANFMWLRMGDRTAEFAAQCEAEGVVIRSFLEGDDQGAGVRITLGEREADERVVKILSSFT